MGCGKTTCGRCLAEQLGAGFNDLDALIVARSGKSIPDIFREGGEPAFRRVEFETLKAFVESASREGRTEVLALGGGAITYGPSREIILSQTLCVYLRTSLETIRERLGDADSSRPLFKDADMLYAARTPIYEKAALAVDTDGRTPQEIAEMISRTAGRQLRSDPLCQG